MTQEVRCAMIGTGAIGKKYARMIVSGAVSRMRLTAVCCRSEESARWAQANLGSGVRVCRDEDELYAHSDAFDAVLIETPHRLHPAMTVRAFREGKHVMCDKPPGITAADARKMSAAAAQYGRLYAMMCHQRTYPQHRRIKALLDESAIGRINRISLVSTGSFRTRYYHQSSSWRSSWRGEGGGALINQGYHLIDLWQYLFGLPLSIYAEIPFGKYNDFRVDDEATLLMQYPDSVTGSFILTTGEGKAAERLEISGSRGRILLENNAVELTRFSDDLRDYARNARVFSREELGETCESTTFEAGEDPYQIMLENFAGAILEGVPLIAPGDDGLKAISMVNAAYLSAWEQRKISLPFDEARYDALLRENEAAEGV